MDIDRIFAGAPAAAVTAHRVFTNRVDELRVFEESLASLTDAAREGGGSVEDLLTPRDNVIMFYGMGGIGKTTLSAELQRRFDAGTIANCAPDGERVSVRLDFAELSSLDPEVTLLRLRGGLGRLTDDFRAFDLAFSVYWERKHPGQPLAEFLDRRSGLVAVNDRMKLSEHVQTGLDSLLGGIGLVGVAWRLGHLLRDGMVNKLTEAAVLRDCPFFEPLVSEVSPDLARPFLPVLLAWDLQRRQRSTGAQIVVFLDTWETVQAQRREPGGAEDALSRLVYLMPNVLFVVGGRSRLTWAEEYRRADLKYAGKDSWAGLGPGPGPVRQYLLGALSPEDSDHYLRQRLVRAGTAAIPDHIRTRIIEGSEGLPLYLDLSAELYDMLAGRGDPAPERFGTTLPQLVSRVIRDLTDGERQLLRAGALVTAFDRDLLSAAAPEQRDATIHRFLSRHFVKDGRVGWQKFAMHDSLRASVREYDAVTEDPWSPAEWREAAARIIGYFRAEIEQDTLVRRAVVYRSRLVEGFLDSMRLSAEFDFAEDWLLDVAKVLSGLGQWQVLQALRTIRVPPGSKAAPIVLGCLAVHQREVGSLEGAHELLDQALGGAPQGAVSTWLSFERAQVLVRQDRNREALLALREVAASSTAGARAAGYWLAVLEQRADRFPAVLRWARSEYQAEPEVAGGAHAMSGFVLLANARFAEAERHFQASKDLEAELSSPVRAALMEEYLAWCVSWTDPGRGAQLAAAAVEANRRMGSTIGIARSIAAGALAAVGRADPAWVLGQAAESIRMMEQAGYHSDCSHPLMVILLVHAVEGDRSAVLQARADIDDLTSRLDTHHHLRHVADWWLEETPPAPGEAAPPVGPADPIEWLDDEQETRNRWVEVLTRRRAYAETMLSQPR